MHVHVGDIIILKGSTNLLSCDNAKEVVYVGPGLICVVNLMYDKTITTYSYRDIHIQNFIYRKGDEYAFRK